jgi:outer membrane lipoprotein SlyB
MKRIRQSVSLVLALTVISLGLVSAQAQTRAYRMSDREVDNLIRRVEQSSDRFRSSFAAAMDRSQWNGTNTEDQLNSYIQNFENAADTLRTRFNSRRSVGADVENLLRQAAFVDDFMTTSRLGGRAQSDWVVVRTDLDALARAYNVTWRWGQTGHTGGGYGTGVGTMPYRVNDQQVDTLLRRIETRADNFRMSIDRALDRGRWDGTRAEDNINMFVQNFEQATDQLRDRFNSRRSVASDVENVLRQATYIDDFVRRNRLNVRAQNSWNLLRTDLNQLATFYNVAWNWDVRALPTPAGGYTAQGGLTGTYRLDAARSDNAQAVADRATMNLPLNQRQRVQNQLMRRLESPSEMAIARDGINVTIASTRAPQTTFVANGTVSREQLPNGSFSRVTAQLNGETLVINSAGNRATDFNVTFEPINNGRQLRVTREIWHDQLGVNPIVIQNFYEKTSDVARFDVYTGGSVYGETAGVNTNTTGDFSVANGERLVATLNQMIDTQNARVGDRFTMTVREPFQYRGATIEGTLASVNRSGRVTGRSDVSFNFDTIRMPNGQTHRFGGFIENVRTPEGADVRIDNEGTVADDASRGRTTVQRGAIGAAVGAIIGAIAGGGDGAAIGAAIGAGAGAGSVYVQGREDLRLAEGTEVTIRASAPNR